MKFKFASLVFFILSGVATPAFAQWSYRIDPAADSNYQCISPSGEIVSGWRSCHADGVCNNAPAVNQLCKTTYGKTDPAPTGGDLTVIKVKLDQVMQPASLTTVFHDCTTNPACKFALDAAAAYVGVDSSLITSAVAKMQKSQVEEDGDFHYILPSGYQYCRAMAETVSVIPPSGDRASLMSLTGSNRELRVQTWTPRLPPGEGRSWVEANFTIIGVRDNLVEQYRARGVCKANYIRAVCRGAAGSGRPAFNGYPASPACSKITD